MSDSRGPTSMYAIYVGPVSDNEGGGYEAYYPQLARGVVGYGATQQEAVEDLLEATPAFAEAAAAIDQTLSMPEPRREWDDFSGKFNVRVPKMLHSKLVRLAEQQGVSPNALVQSILSSGTTALDAGHEFGAVPRDRAPLARGA